MQILYLIRHTRPDIKPGICYGQLDVDVSDSFSTEAACARNYLPPLDLIITSPLLRTRKLAGFLAQNCEVQSDARLMEKHFGCWEGLAWNDIERGEIDDWAADLMGYTPTGGESAQQFMQRIQDFLRDLTRRPHSKIALVAHGGTIRTLLALLSGMPLSDTLNWQIDFGAVITVKIDGA